MGRASRPRGGIVSDEHPARRLRRSAAAEGADELDQKLAECVWWLMVLADRTDIDLVQALERFLANAERRLPQATTTVSPAD